MGHQLRSASQQGGILSWHQLLEERKAQEQGQYPDLALVAQAQTQQGAGDGIPNLGAGKGTSLPPSAQPLAELF